MWGSVSYFRSNYTGSDFEISQDTGNSKIYLHHVVNDFSGGNKGSHREIPVNVEDLEKLRDIIDEALTAFNKRSLKVYFAKSATGELMLLKLSGTNYTLVDFNSFDGVELLSLSKDSGRWLFIEKPTSSYFEVFEKLGLIELDISYNETIDFEKLKGLPLDRLEEAIVPIK